MKPNNDITQIMILKSTIQKGGHAPFFISIFYNCNNWFESINKKNKMM